MPSSLKSLLNALLLLASLQKGLAESKTCFYEEVSDNSAVVDNNVNCLNIPETSAVGATTCVFRVGNATGIEFVFPLSTFVEYNSLEFVANTDNSITVSLVQKKSYTRLLDTIAPPTSSTLETTLNCFSVEGYEVASTIYVDIDEENSQTPRFLETSYAYYDVPEIWPEGSDFSIDQFGRIIIAEDRDNTFGSIESPASEIIFELQGMESEDFEVITVKNFTKWPYTYRALLSSKKPFDYQVHPSYQLLLVARNADGMRESAVNVTLVLKDLDNMNPAFTVGYYLTSVGETMLQTPGTYPLECTPEINAYDQDTGIDEALTYSINSDCGESSYCEIVKTHFEINNVTGALSFISNGEWPYQTTAISFLIKASQVDKPDKAGYAEVIPTFELPGTVVSGYAQ